MQYICFIDIAIMSRSADLSSLCNVWDVKALARFPNSDTAQAMLQRLAKQVEPICLNHQWRVRELKEFFPNNESLQGMNVGQGAVIHIRLRPASDRATFLPWPYILGTMLHELCHMEVGPHNDAFYRLLDKLWDEVEALPEVPGPGGSAVMVVDARTGRPVAGGAAGWGGGAAPVGPTGTVVGAGAASSFAGDGHRLGGRRIPWSGPAGPANRGAAREAAAAAADRRLAQTRVMSGGHRLGTLAESTGLIDYRGVAGVKRPSSAELPRTREARAALVAAATERRLAQAAVDRQACGNAYRAGEGRGQGVPSSSAAGSSSGRPPQLLAGAGSLRSAAGRPHTSAAPGQQTSRPRPSHDADVIELEEDDHSGHGSGAGASHAHRLQAGHGHDHEDQRPLAIEVIELDEDGREVHATVAGPSPSQDDGKEEEDQDGYGAAGGDGHDGHGAGCGCSGGCDGAGAAGSSRPGPSHGRDAGAGAGYEDDADIVVLDDDYGDGAGGSAAGAGAFSAGDHGAGQAMSTTSSSSSASSGPQQHCFRAGAGVGPPSSSVAGYVCVACTYAGPPGSVALACEVCGTPLQDNSWVPPALVWGSK